MLQLIISKVVIGLCIICQISSCNGNQILTTRDPYRIIFVDEPENNDCILPTGLNGSCVLITECPSAPGLIASGHRLGSICRFEGRTPVICCSKNTELPFVVAAQQSQGNGSGSQVGDSGSKAHDESGSNGGESVGNEGESVDNRGESGSNGGESVGNEGESVDNRGESGGESVRNLGASVRNGGESAGNAENEETSQQGGEGESHSEGGLSSQLEEQQQECATYENIQPGIRAKRRLARDITFGDDAEQGSWPWMAAIFLKETISRNAPFCGGSLISRNTVLTAAHCFIDFDGPNKCKYVVVLGDLKLGDDSDELTPVEVGVSSVISHEGYKFPSVYNDIAILKLAITVNFTPNIRMICLPDVTMRNYNLEDGNAMITGWGHLRFGGASSPALQEAGVPIVDNSQCDEVYKTVLGVGSDDLPIGITKDIICAGNDKDNKDACQGDSGGPLVYRHHETKNWILIGIIASGFECGRGIPGLYTRVSEYLHWIGCHN